MRKALAGILVVQTALVVVFVVALRAGRMPLGVHGEWEWLRLLASAQPSWYGVLFAILALGAYAVIVGAGMRSLSARASRVREVGWVLLLLVLATAVQIVIPCGAPDEYDLTRWAYVPYFSSSTGYYQIAKQQIHDPWQFLAEYPEWIRHQDALHVGTHPPGMLLLEHGLLRAMETHPRAARGFLDAMPGAVRVGFRSLEFDRHLSLADRSALALTSALAWLACAATVVPLYLLARANLPAPLAWTAAALWPLVPATLLFQPLADTAFPLLSTTALALAAWSGRAARWGGVLACAAGVVLAAGLAFTLAFVPVGLIVGITLATTPGQSGKRRALRIVATGIGFLGPTLLVWGLSRANPFVIWWWNQRNHARFYVEYPRSYRAWVVANPVECALALGIPSAAWAVAGFFHPRQVPRSVWATFAVLLLLNFSGRNLSEVARLWLPLMPPLLLAAAVGLSRSGGGFKTLMLAVVLLGVEILVLQTTIQVVYPVSG